MTPTPEQIEAWAREAGAGFDDAFESVGPNPMWAMSPEELQRFAALACAWQRERDAQICERVRHGGNGTPKQHEDTHADGHTDGCNECEWAIRSDCADGAKS